jgi:hypothetical protein
MDPTNNNNDKMGKEGGEKKYFTGFLGDFDERFQLVIKTFDFALNRFVVVFLGRIVSPPLSRQIQCRILLRFLSIKIFRAQRSLRMRDLLFLFL